MKQFQTPQETSISGFVVSTELVKAANNENVSRDFIAIQIMDTNEVVRALQASPSMIAEFGLSDKVFEGNYVSLTVLNCVAGVTGYEDADGNELTHEKDHVQLVNATNVPAAIMRLKKIDNESISEINQARALKAVEFKREETFRAGRSTTATEDQIAMLLSKLASTENESVRASINTRLAQLGHVVEPVKTKATAKA